MKPDALRWLSLILILVVPGCMPSVTHAPRVSDGWASGGQFSVGVGRPGERNDYPVLFPPTVLFARHGWAADSITGEWGRHVGAQISPFTLIFGLGNPEDRAEVLRSLQGNGYVQFPGENPRGVGLVASSNSFMPYVQYGMSEENGDSWYTTQSVGYIAYNSRSYVFISPAITFRELGFRGRHAAHFQFGGLAGYSSRNREHTPIWMVTAGLVIELNSREVANDE